MNAQAHEFVSTLLGVLGKHPEATGISIHALKAWAIILITASSDEAVIALDEKFELGGTEIQLAGGRWWRRATSENRQGTWRVVVTGPHHLGPPPDGNAGDASS